MMGPRPGKREVNTELTTEQTNAEAGRRQLTCKARIPADLIKILLKLERFSNKTKEEV